MGLARNRLTRRLRAKLADLRQPAKAAFVPDYSTEAFVQALKSNPASPLSTVGHGSDPALAAAAVQYFQDRAGQVFFHRADRMAEIVSQYHARYGDWSERTLRQVVREHEDHSQVYALTAPPLVPGFCWDGIAAPPGGDIQFRKKPHRFSFLPRMAIAATRETLVLNWMLDLLQDWTGFAQGDGAQLAFDSNLAVIQRLVGTCWSWLILNGCVAGAELDALKLLLIRIIRVDIEFLVPRLGSSYANNHLLADFFAGWMIYRLFPEFSAFDEALAGEYEERWTAELFRQTYDDGGSFEHSAHYQEFACDLALAYCLLSRCNNWPTSPQFDSRLRSMLYYQVVLGGRRGNPCEIGDCIQDNFFSLGIHKGLGPALYHEAYRYLFDSALPAVQDHLPAKECAFWLLGGIAPAPDGSAVAGDVTIDVFPTSGLISIDDHADELTLVFRTGPAPGTEFMAGHAHADLLNIYITRAGRALVCPSGSYTYRSNPERWPQDEPPWRHYFRGPESGNGVVALEEDPLGYIHKGDFRRKDVSTRVHTRVDRGNGRLSWTHGELVDAGVFSGGARGLVQLQGYYTLVYDLHPPHRSLDFDSLQFSPECNVSLQGHRLVAGCPAGEPTYFYFCSSSAGPELFTGSIEPLAGWVSHEYGQKAPAPQVRCPFRPGVSHSCKLISTVDLGAVQPEMVNEGGVLAITCALADRVDLTLIDIEGNGMCRSYPWGESDARLCWTRWIDSELHQLRALQVQKLVIAPDIQIYTREKEDWVELSHADGVLEITTASGMAPIKIAGAEPAGQGRCT